MAVSKLNFPGYYNETRCLVKNARVFVAQRMPFAGDNFVVIACQPMKTARKLRRTVVPFVTPSLRSAGMRNCVSDGVQGGPQFMTGF